MAYADQQMSGNRIAALVVVALIHIGIGYVLVTGLAYEAVQKAVERVTTVDIDEPEPEPEDEPPPPPEEVPQTTPPPFIPPPRMNIPQERPVQQSTDRIIENQVVDRRPTTQTCSDGRIISSTAQCGPATQTCPDGRVIRADAVCPKPEPVKPKFTPKDPTPRGSPGRWVSDRDYPSRAMREERQGTVRFSLSVDATGDVTNCRVTGSSGHSDLDDTACKLMQRRGKFNPATDGNGDKVAGSWSSAFRWQIPE